MTTKILLSESDLYCGLARRADLNNERFDRVVEHLASYDLGELAALRGWTEHWSRRWEFPFAVSSMERRLPDSGGDNIVKIIESGCGTTTVPFWLSATPGRQITGVDLDPACAEGWDKASVNCRHPESMTRFAMGDMEDLPFDDNSFDAGYSVSAIEHTRRPELAVSELCRVIKPGGNLVLTMDIDICASHATTSPGVFLSIQEILEKNADYDAPVRWLGPREILTFENRTVTSNGTWQRAMKALISKFGLRSTADFAVFGYVGRMKSTS